MLDTSWLDVEDAAMVRTVQLIVEDHGVFEGVVSVGLIKGLLMGATTQKRKQFTFVSGYNDSPLLVFVIPDVYDLSFSIPQLDWLAYLSFI